VTDRGASTAPAVEAADADRPVALRCAGLVKNYGELRAVDGLDLEVFTGECFGLLGPNGAGKTTTIEILEGLLTPDAGLVEVLGRSWSRDERVLRARLGIQLQETRFSDRLTVVEILRLFRSFYPDGYSVDESLDLLELDVKRDARFAKLSGGQKQRLSVACALVGRPELLFLDEPTTGLDPQSRRQLWDLLTRYRAEQRTVLLTTHYMEEAATLCDRVAIVDRGRVIALGTPRELVSSLEASTIVEFTLEAGASPPSLERVPGVYDVRVQNGAWTFATSEAHLVVPALLDALTAAGVQLSSLTTHTATLEDVFVAKTGRHLRDA